MRSLCAALFVIVAFSPLSVRSGVVHAEPAYTGKLDDDAWKRHIETQARRQGAGQKPPCHDNCDWKSYWVGWYDEIRISSGLPWPGSEFKTHEDMIRYIKNRLKAHGLPTYE